MALPFVKADAWTTGSIEATCGWLPPGDNVGRAGFSYSLRPAPISWDAACCSARMLRVRHTVSMTHWGRRRLTFAFVARRFEVVPLRWTGWRRS